MSGADSDRHENLQGVSCYHLHHRTMAEEIGFEPMNPCGLTVFRTVALNLSATLPLDFLLLVMAPLRRDHDDAYRLRYRLELSCLFVLAEKNDVEGY